MGILKIRLLTCPHPVSYTHLDVYKRQAFTIEGGPGYITSESDHLSVTPIHFNAETTQIRVEAKSLSATAMWTELTLSTSMESVKIPVVAQWETVKAHAAITP